MRHEKSPQTEILSGAAASGARRAGEGFPTVHAGGISTPVSNTGVNLQAEETVVRGRRIFTTLAKRSANKRLAFIDWLTFTFHENTLNKTAGQTMIDSDSYIIEASRIFEKIFGFGVTQKNDKGQYHYKESWVLGEKFGLVCFGGQRETMCVALNGIGCLNAAEGWEKRLYDFLTQTCIRPNISRVDLCHDDFEGRYLSPDWAIERWRERGFNSSQGGRLVNVERYGNWDCPTGAGRTANFGIRTSGKFCRVYEKGKKEGEPDSLWCRAEVEFKSCDRIIPADVLLEPSSYFAGAYPCFEAFMHEETAKRFELKQKTAEITVDAAVRIVKHQFGKYHSFFSQLFGEAWLEKCLSDDRSAVPKRMASVMAGMGKAREYIHETVVSKVLDIETDFIPSFVKRPHTTQKDYLAHSRGV